MGRLKIFDRRVPLAPDDVYVPGLYGVVLHSVWLASTAVVYAVIRNDCNVSPVLLDFLVILICTLSIQVPLDALIMFLSMSGTVARKGPRRYVSAAVHVSCVVLVWELALECYGIYVTYGPGNYLQPVETPDCQFRMDSSSPILIHMVVIWSFLAIIFYFLTLGVLLAGSEHKSGSKLDDYIKIWQSRLNYAVGTGGLVDSDVLRDVAGELAIYFKDFDWAPSDVAVGLLLLKREQKKITEIRQARRLIIEQPTGFSIPFLEDQSVRDELAKVQGEEESRRMTFMNGGRGVRFFNPPSKKKQNRTFDSKQIGSRLSQTLSMSASPIPEEIEMEGIKSRDIAVIAPVQAEIPSFASLQKVVESSESVKEPAIVWSNTAQGVESDADESAAEEKPKESPTKPVTSPLKSIENLKSGPERLNSIPERQFETTAPLKSDDEIDQTASATTPNKHKMRGKFSLPNFKSPSMSAAMNPSRSSKTSPNNPNPVPQFRPFQFRKKKQMGHHRRRPEINHGTVLREEIDDILHFARYAEVVYTPEEINMIYSDRLHFHSNDNGIYKSPFLIVHDVDTDSIVIAIRGTYSAADVLVDLKFDVMPLSIPELEGEEEEHLAHSGFMHTANNIVGDIRRLNILGPLLNDPSSEFYGCSLVVTGHSLGAGVAALVANILRYDFPSTCCYAFEPPGCVVSRKAAQHFEHFCTSVVMGDDVVTRLSRNTLEMLKLDISRHLKNCEEPKWKVFGSVLGDRICCTSNSKNSTSSRRRGAKLDRPGLLHRRTPSGHLIPEDLEKLKRRTNSLRAGKNGEDNPFAEMQLPTPPMYIPGKILHMEKLRRPPLNMNQVVGRQIRKVMGVTKAVGKGVQRGAEGFVDMVFEGAEIIKDGAADLGDMILDGADAIMDGAEGIKEKIVGDKKERHQNTYSSGLGASGSGAQDEQAVHEPVEIVALKDADQRSVRSAKKRSNSMGDVLDMKSARAQSTGDTRLRFAVDTVDPQVLSGDSDEAAEKAAAAMDKSASKKIVFGKGVSMAAEGSSSRGERKSRRRKRRLERARSAGNIRSKSVGARDGYVSNADESGVSSSDEDLPGNEEETRVSRFGMRRSRSKRADKGALTDTEVFSDNELADLGGVRHKDDKPEKKQTLASVLGGGVATKRLSGRASEYTPRKAYTVEVEVSNSTSFLGPAATNRLSVSPTRMRVPMDQINPSIKPRAHIDAIPSESITGRVVPVKPLLSPGSPLSPNGVMIIDVVSPGKTSPLPPAAGELTYDLPFTPIDPDINPKRSMERLPATTEPLKEIDEEEEDQIGRMPTVRFHNSTASVISRDELVLSKPQYPPVLNPKDKGKKPELTQGPRVHGKYHYVPRWARKEEFQEIIVSRSMIADHSPFELLREFQAAPAGSVLGVVTRN